ncbi:unnamed protein product [Cuscuta epithymum]|uniref:Uncharacterized protein n=1 Tax=Cuscuta epithymum TaxID=186058 RepID=A0AAV0GJD4_9ASTE|nr:unnamed protein product [Cuscuta epithymum]
MPKVDFFPLTPLMICFACFSNFFVFFASADFTMSRKLFMTQAKKMVDKEMQAAQHAEASKASGDGSKSQADAAKKAAAQKKKKRPTEGQQTLTEAGLKPAQGAKRPKQGLPSGDAATADAQAAAQKEQVSDVHVIEDLTLNEASAALVPTSLISGKNAQASSRSGRDLASGLYEVTVRYPTKGGLFNERVSSHDVLFQAIPDEDRAYLRRQGKEVRLFDGGLDYVVQGALMLMEQHRRQEEEIARLQEAEKRAASADEALASLELLRSEVGSLKEMADVAEARAAAAEAKLEGEAAARRLAEEKAKKAEELKAEAERAVEKAVDLFMAEGWKADEHRQFCFKVVADRFQAWSQEDPAGQAFWKQEMEVFYDLGQRRMQMLVYRRLRRRVKNLKPQGIGLPRLMKDPEEELKLPLAERQRPILSSDEEKEP